MLTKYVFIIEPLNNITMPRTDTHDPPWIENLIDLSSRVISIFSNIDMNLDYHQVPIEQTDVWKKTFKSKE
jgi:hypothetical protein